MADVAVAVPPAAPADEDEKYLYGESSESAQKKEDSKSGELHATAPEFLENGETIKKEDDDEDGEFEESDDDDEDNIQVHIGEVNTAVTVGPYGTPVSWKKDGIGAAGAVKTATLPTQGQKKIDVNAVGLVNGQPIYEYDLESEQDEKPWRKPGADISDYFNYGFTEDTWKQYCEKQRRMRLEGARGGYVLNAANNLVNSAQLEIEVLPDGRTRVKAGPPPDRKVEGSIHVIGSDADARRKQKEDELLALALGSSHVITPQTFPGQRPMYTALPNGTMVYNPMGATSQADGIKTEGSQVASQGQQIQSLGAQNVAGIPPSLQYLPPGTQAITGMHSMGGPQIFPPPNLGMEFPHDPFVHPGSMQAPGGFGYGGQFGNSDSDFDSDEENRRHRSRREPSRHRRHRDRSDRDKDRSDRDRDRSKARDRDRSTSRRRDHSKSSSDRKKHSCRSSSSVRGEDGEESSERKSRSSRRSKQASEEEPKTNTTTPEIKQEPVGD